MTTQRRVLLSSTVLQAMIVIVGIGDTLSMRTAAGRLGIPVFPETLS